MRYPIVFLFHADIFYQEKSYPPPRSDAPKKQVSCVQIPIKIPFE